VHLRAREASPNVTFVKDREFLHYRAQKSLLQRTDNNQTTTNTIGIDSDQRRSRPKLEKLINGRSFKKPRLEATADVPQFNANIPTQIVVNEQEHGRRTYWTSYHDLAFFEDERRIKTYDTDTKRFSYRYKSASDFNDHGFRYYVERQRYPDQHSPNRGRICFFDQEGRWIEIPNPHNHLINERVPTGEPVFRSWKVRLPSTSQETGLVLACQYYVLYILHSPSEKRKYIIPIEDPFEDYFYTFERVQAWTIPQKETTPPTS